MGACGCCDGFGDFRFPGPNGGWYTLQIYTGCVYCDEGPGVNLGFYSPGDPAFDHILELPEVQIGELFGVPTTDWNETAKAIKREWADDNNVTHVVEEELPNAIIHGAHAVAQRWIKAVVHGKK